VSNWQQSHDKDGRSVAVAMVCGIAPLAGLSIRLDVAFMFGLVAFAVILVLSLLLALIRDVVRPSWLLAYAMVCAGLLVTLAEVILGLLAPGIRQLIGVYLPALAMSPFVLDLADDSNRAFPTGRFIGRSAGMAGRFLVVMTGVAAFRELLSDGRLTVIADLPTRFQLVVPGLSDSPVGFLASAAGGLMLAGLILALGNWRRDRTARQSGEAPLEDEA
jgi:Na+-translocating ferredoxin:NAD+ oxidoreductase RnfE subunit